MADIFQRDTRTLSHAEFRAIADRLPPNGQVFIDGKFCGATDGETLEAGVPDGVINSLPGFGETAGKAIGLHNDIDTASFTGSIEVGRMLMRYSGDSNLKAVGLEMGDDSHLPGHFIAPPVFG